VKKKIKLKKKVKIILVIIFLILIIVTIPLGINLYTKNKLLKLNYSLVSVKNIMDKEKNDYIYEVGYIKTLDVAFSSNDYKEKFLKSYEVIPYQEQEDFIANVNTLLEKGYTNEEVILITSRGNNESVTLFASREKVDDIKDYMQFEYASLENYDRYVSYQLKEREDEENTVTFVEIGLDLPFFENANIIEDFNITLLANKYNKLSENYVPDDLMKIKDEFSKDDEQMLSKIACVAFEEMATKALEENIYIEANSAYRSYETQQEVYDENKNLYGLQYAENYVARAGFSEHQTGLALDIKSKDTNVFSNSDEYSWVKENAHLYGFIMRYPKGKEYITGYKYESWHYRYVGVDIATYIYENDITYDEYYVRFLAK